MVKRSDHSTSSTDKEVLADQAAKLKAKDAPLGQLQDVLPGTEIGWVATEVEGAQLPDVGMQPAADTPQATATVDSDLSVATDAGVTQPHAEQLEEPVTEAPVLSGSASSSGVEQVAGASAWLGDVDEVGVLALAGAAQPGLAGNNFTVPPLPSVGSIPALNVHVGVDGEASLDPQVLSTLTASGDTTGQLREDGQQIASGQLNSAGASGAVSWQLDHSAGLYGQLQLSGDGQWRYTLDNASSKVQGLCAGEQVSEHFIAAVTDSAGRTQFIPLTIAIDGSADHAIISGTDVGQANEDKLLLVSGMLTVQDADAGQAQFKPAVLTGSFGLLTLDTVGHWVYGLDNANPAVQALGAGKAATDVLTVTSIDGTTHHVTITVHGSNDQALIVGAHSGALTEDSLLSVQGRLNVTDIDQGEASFVPQTLAGTFGQLQLDMAGHWTYLLDNTNPAVQALGAGAAATDMLTVTTLDGTPQQITITIKGSNDAAQIAGTLTGAVTEESTLIAKGTLTVTDVDQGQDRFNPEVFNGQYGSFSLDANGHWLYVLDNSNAAVQGLAAGEQVRDVMTVTSVDGTSCQLVVSVNGSNDAPVLTAQSQTVTEDGTRLSGRMVATDVDTSDTHVFSTANAVDGFTLNADGSYSFDPSNAAYQHLAAGQTQDVVIPVTVTDSAGATSTQNLNITVTGVNDGAVISGVSSGTITEDQSVRGGQLQASGQLTVTDVDTGEDHFIMQTGVAGSSGLGHFSLDATGAWTYTADNTQTAIQQLKAGESLTDMLSVTSADGATHMLTVTLQGSNDVPVLTAQTQAVTEDGAQLQGRMVATDVDAGDTFVFSTANAVDGFTLNSDGSYSFDPAHAAYQHLSAGQTQDVVIPVTVTDSNGATATQSLTITVTGTNDAAVVGGRLTNTLTEDSVVSTGGMLRAGGQLTVLDPDAGEAVFVVEAGVTGAGHYGSFSIDASGHYSYIADNTQAAIQQLKAGETLTDRFTVATADGTQQVVTITINGAEDRPVLHAQTHAVTEDGTRLTGQMLATDVDAGDTQRFSTPQAVAGFTLNADGSYSFDPSNAAYQRLAAGQTQDVVIPVTVTDSAGATATQNLNITVTGVNDGAVISGVSSGTITEDQSVQGGQLQASGQLTVTDVDTGEDHFIAQTDVVGSSGLGHFSLDATGAWNYTADNTQTAIQQLKAGESLTDTLSVASADGATHMLTVTIQGSNDVPVLSAQTQAVTEGGAKLQGRMIAIDVDPGDTFVFSIANAVDGFTLNADGGYSFDPAHAAYQHLSAGQTQDVVIPVTVTDSAGATSTQNLTITVSGSNDGATIAGVNTGATVEDKPQAVTGQLTIADVDDGQAHFVAQSGVAGTYGTFTLNEQGQWSYQLDNSKPAVQALKTGDSVTDSFTLTSADGTAHQVTVTVTGKDDGAVIGGTDTAVVSEDGNVNAGHLDATGQLTIIDPDAGQSQFIAQTATPGTYGEFTIDATGAWHYQANNSRTEIQLLKVGESLTDTLTVTSTDGTTHQIQITINGTNDAPTLTAQAQAVSEDGAQLTGHMVATDVDQGDSQIYSNQNPPAGFTLNADGSYSFDPSNAAYQHLIAGQTQDVVIPITVTDSAGSTSTQNLTITVTGTNDGAVVSGRLTNTLTEDSVVSTGGMLRAGGQLTVVDPDAGEAVFVVQAGVTGVGHYGSFSIDASGHYSYIADNTQAAIQRLKAGETLTDRFTVATADGTQQVVTITINGAEDRPVLQAQTHAVSEDGARLTGQMLATDVDAGDTQRFSVAHPVAGFVLNPDGSFSFNPATASYQHLAAGQTQDVVIPVTVIDSAGGTSTQNLTITVTGKNDGATISGVNTGSTAEDNTQVVTGQLTVADVDDGQAHFVAQSGSAGTYGTFSLNEQGQWSYALDNGKASVQALKTGDSVTDSFTVTSADGTSHQVTVTVTGKNDGALIGGADTASVTEDASVTAGKLEAQGQLTITDPDAGQNHFTAQRNVAGTYGTFSIDQAGHWTYTVNNSQGAVQQLKAGDSLIDSMTIASADGTTHTLLVAIQGSNDAPILTAQAQSVTEDGALLTGQMVATDVDKGDTQAFSTQNPPSGFTLNPDGSYRFDPSDTAYQRLAAGQTQDLIIPVTVTDSAGATSTQNLVITVTGTNDAPVISGTATANLTEDAATRSVTKTLTTTDADAGDAAAWSLVGSGQGTYGQLVFDAQNHRWTYTLDNADADTNALHAGQRVTEIFQIAATDKAGATVTQEIRVNIAGANDAPTIAGTATGTVIESDNAHATIGGTLTHADVDSADTFSWSLNSGQGTYGSLAFDTTTGQWGYTLDESRSATQGLNAGQTVTETFTVTGIDKAGAKVTQTITVAVQGTNDNPVVAGAHEGSVVEDRTLLANGTLTSTDLDSGDTPASWQVLSPQGTYGALSIDSHGAWTYRLDVAASQSLKAGATVDESFVVRVTDQHGGTTDQALTVHVTGSNDAPKIDATQAALGGDVTEDKTGATSAGGTITSGDPDLGDTHTWALAGSTGTTKVGQYGTFTLGADGTWSYVLDHAKANVLAEGANVTETFNIHVTDAAGERSTAAVTVRVHGTNDGPAISGQSSGDVTENTSPSVTGTLASGDPDRPDPGTWAVVGNGVGQFGSLSLDNAGHWTYALANTPNVEALGDGDKVQETFAVKVTDSHGLESSQQITVNVHGSNDAPSIAGTTSGQVAEDLLSQVSGSLSTTDVDRGDHATFDATNFIGNYGQLSIDKAGLWTYELFPADPHVQALAAGQRIIETFNVAALDEHGGVTHQPLTVTVVGTNDVPRISGVSTGVAIANMIDTAQGRLVGYDKDIGDTGTWSLGNGHGRYGELTLNAQGEWTYQLDMSRPETRNLQPGQQVSESFTVRLTDHEGAQDTSHINVTVFGTQHNSGNVGGTPGGNQPSSTNPATGSGPTAIPPISVSVTEDDVLQQTGRLPTIQRGSTGFTWQISPVTGVFGDLAIDRHGHWQYHLHDGAPQVQALSAGQTVQEVFSVAGHDPSGHQVQSNFVVDIHGTNDKPQIVGVDSGVAVEDVHNDVTGSLAVIDPDAGESAAWLALDTQGKYGSFSVDQTGNWHYQLDPNLAQGLNAGQSVVEVFRVQVTDKAGAVSDAQEITVQVQGTADGPKLRGILAGPVNVAQPTVAGVMPVLDHDIGDQHTFSLQSPAQGAFGSLTLSPDGHYQYQLDPNSAKQVALGEGQQVTETFMVKVTDTGGRTYTRQLTVEVQGTNDAPTIRGALATSATEDTQTHAHGQLTLDDPDTGDNVSLVSHERIGQYGVFDIGDDGKWTYALDNINPVVQALGAGQTLTDRVQITIRDEHGLETTKEMVITVRGTNDVPVIAGDIAGAVTEDGATQAINGQLTTTDADTGDHTTWTTISAPGTYGTFNMGADGAWHYQLNNTSNAVQTLAAGQVVTEQFIARGTDGHGGDVTQTINVTVTGANDTAKITGQFAGAVTEDHAGGLAANGRIMLSDVDAGQGQLTAQTLAGQHGTLTLLADGHWSYTGNNADAAVQALGAGKTLTDTINVATPEGGTQAITITFTGVNDRAVIAGTSTASVTEDSGVTGTGKIEASGQLTVSDVDTGEAVFAAQTNVAGSNHYGTFSIDTAGHWTYSADNGNAAIQGLKQGATLTDTLTVSSADGASQTITVNIVGTNDVPTLTAQSHGVTEDGAKLTGQMVATDLDTGDTQTFSAQNPPAGLTLNLDGSYTFDPSDAAYQHLVAGQNETLTIPVTVTDSAGATSTQNLTITVTGSNDTAVVSGRVANSVTEDGVVSTAGMLRAGGQLTVLDPDTGEAVFVAQTGVAGAGHYGSFSLDASGHYSYSADNTQAAIQQLKAGETLTDRFTVATADGTQQVVTITINGTEDKPVLQAQTHAVTEDGAQLQGRMVATDVDAGDTQVFSTAQVIDGFTLNADGSYSFDPANAAYQHLAAGQTQNLVIPITVTDSAGATSTQNLTITLSGTNDSPTISGVNSGATIEDNTQAVTGQLTISDVDDGQAHFVAQSGVAGTYGTFTLNEQGLWSYTLDNSKSEVQAIKAGDSVTDSFTVTSADGSTHQVTVTVTGKDDGAVIGGSDSATVTEDSNAQSGQLQASGTLTVIDPDAGQDHFTAQTNAAGTYGNFSIDATGHWSYSADNSQTAIQQLKTGDTLTDQFTVTSADGTSHTVSVTLKGSNDAPTLTAQAQAVTEDGASLTGHMVATDLDAGDTQAFSTQNPPAGFTLNADGSYSFDPTDAAYQHLAAGQTQTLTFPITVTDSAGATSTQNLAITLTGTNDTPTIAGVNTGVTTEDSTQAVTGQLTVADVDDGQAHFVAQSSSAGTYGTFFLNEQGQWSYALDNSKASVQALKTGDSVTDSFTVSSADGTSHTVTVTVNGNNDAATITGADQLTVQEDTRIQAGGNLAVGGKIDVADVDSGEAQFNAQLHAVGTGGYGEFNVMANGAWTYSAANSQVAIQQLRDGQTLTDSLQVTSADGTSHTITVTINGKDDKAVISGDISGMTPDDDSAISGVLTITDPDAGQAQFVAQVDRPGIYGSFSVTADGHWTYTPDSRADVLKAGESHADNMIVTSADGTQKFVLITVTGSQDGAVIGGVVSGDVTEDTAPSVTGRLTIDDPDAGDAAFKPGSTTGSYGGLFLKSDGEWTYNLDNTNAKVQALAPGESLTDEVTVASADGTPQKITITISGTIDTPTLSAAQETTHFNPTDASAVVYGTTPLLHQVILTGLDTAAIEQGGKLDLSLVAGGASANFNYTNGIGVGVTGASGAQIEKGETLIIQLQGASRSANLQLNSFADHTLSTVGSDDDRAHWVAYDHLGNKVAEGDVLPDRDPAQNGRIDIQTTQPFSYIAIQATDNTRDSFVGNSRFVVKSVDAALIQYDTKIDLSGHLTDQPGSETLSYRISGLDASASFNHGTLNADGSWTISTSESQDLHLLHGADQTLHIEAIATAAGVSASSVPVDLKVTTAGMSYELISGNHRAQTDEDARSPVGGTLHVDTDAATVPGFMAQHVTTAYGAFDLKADGHWTYSVNSVALQSMSSADSQHETFTVATSNGVQREVTVDIKGLDDATVVGGQLSGDVTEDSHTTTQGRMTFTDVDTDLSKISAIAHTYTGLYGTLNVNADGSWSYSLDPAKANVLKAGEVVHDVFATVAVKTDQGAFSRTRIDISVHGDNDGAVIGGTDTGSVTEDRNLTAGKLATSGQLTVTDQDAGQDHFTAQTDTATTYGHFSIDASGHWTYAADNSQLAIQQLKTGDSLTDTLSVTSADGTLHTVTVSIHGVNDAPAIGTTRASARLVIEDAPTSSITGLLYGRDTDAGDTLTWSVSGNGQGTYGHLALDTQSGRWTYQLDNADADTNTLRAGQQGQEVFQITVTDSTGASGTSVVRVMVIGTDDRAVIAGVDTGSVTEDTAVQSGQLKASGQLTVSDVDTGEEHFTVQTDVATAYGLVSIDAAGHWTYAADNSQAAIQQLKAGDTLTDTLTVTSAGGTQHTLTITLQGQDDQTVIGGVDTGTVSEDGVLQATGQLSISDADGGDAAFQARPRVPGQHGVFGLATDGSWIYALNNSDTDVQALSKGQSLSDSLVVKSVDGSTHTITVSIEGRDDSAVIAGVNTGRVTEDQSVQAGQLQASGQLTLTDADAGQHLFTVQNQVAGHYGSFSIDASGAWIYTADNSQDAVQQLGRNDSLSERFRVTSDDGSQHIVLVTLQGSNDAPVVLAQTRSVTEDGAKLTGQMRASDIDIHDRLQFSTTAQIAGFTLAADGSYSFDPRASAYQNLGSGVDETLRIPVTVRDPFGAQHTRDLLITVTGTNDGAIIQGRDTGDVVEDLNPVGGLLRTQGQLTVRDPDAAQSSFVAQTDVVGRYGHFSIDAAGAWTYQADNASTRVQELREGAQAMDHFVVRSLDGSTHSIRITVHGTNDVPVVTAAAQSVTEDGALLFGQLRVNDRDRGDQQLFQLDHPVAGFTLSDDGSYRFDPKDPAHQDLREGQVMRLDVPVTVTDSAGAVVHQTLSITLTGRNDGAMISGVDSAVVTEDVALQNGLLQAHGQLMVSDLDAGEAQFMPIQDLAGKFGHLSLNTDGSWVYQADNSSAAVQALGKGQSATERFTVHSVEGTAHEVSVTLQGADEAQSNHAPTATEGADLGWVHNNDSISFSQWDLLSKVQAQDADSSDRLQVVGLHIDPYYGRVDQLADGGFRFTPTAGLARLDEPFTIEISDGHSTTTTHATLDVIAVQTSSAPPVAPEAHVAPIEATASFSPVEGASGASDDHENHAASSNLGGNGNNFAEAHSDSHQADSDYIAQGHQAGQSHDGLAASDDVAVTFAAGSQFAPVHDYLQFAGSAMPAAAMGEHSGTSNSAVHEYLAAAGIDSLTPTADEMHMPPTAVLMDLQHAGVSGEHTAANEQSVDPAADDLAAIENPLADDPNQHHGGI